jgi:predicted DNA-binding transcriptional regulator AlpA
MLINQSKLSCINQIGADLMKMMITAREVAEMYGVSLPTVWRWNKIGVIPKGRKIGGKVLWNRPQIEAHLSEPAS